MTPRGMPQQPTRRPRNSMLIVPRPPRIQLRIQPKQLLQHFIQPLTFPPPLPHLHLHLTPHTAQFRDLNLTLPQLPFLSRDRIRKHPFLLQRQQPVFLPPDLREPRRGEDVGRREGGDVRGPDGGERAVGDRRGGHHTAHGVFPDARRDRVGCVFGCGFGFRVLAFFPRDLHPPPPRLAAPRTTRSPHTTPPWRRRVHVLVSKAVCRTLRDGYGGTAW
ncbi:uncharacterized protein EV422DRAFT_528674 [Fimicolochytrium jonesii]|uniref:uncharacterized protein n=1 Tax=Fimicolochytrium jonesii TaxID=1396493 RepID=UPI0022FE2E63|nr:uncharacterized protein EV422DRAFT_528674 [Fimicolochytrium jonesii]KAI8820995.1 hypothetical protein EV422DRAFT_528674 [Fimicolochytrium jonesii]